MPPKKRTLPPFAFDADDDGQEDDVRHMTYEQQKELLELRARIALEQAAAERAERAEERAAAAAAAAERDRAAAERERVARAAADERAAAAEIAERAMRAAAAERAEQNAAAAVIAEARIRELQMQVELARLRGYDVGLDRRDRPVEFNVHNATKRLPNFDERNNVDSYLSTFEKIAVTDGWPRDKWCAILHPLLTGKAQQAFDKL